MKTELQQLVAALPTGVAHAGRLGLILAPETPATLRQELIARLTHLSRASTGERHTLTAWLGDLLASAPRLRRGQITAYALAAGLDAGTLSNAKLVCSRIPVSCRHEGLSWSHHCEVALAISDRAEIERWLSKAEAQKLSAGELRRAMREHLAAVPRRRASQIAGFALMRELRAASRACEKMKPMARHWPRSARRLALIEIKPLTELIDFLQQNSAKALPSAPRPRDMMAN